MAINKINITIAGRKYPVTYEDGEEEVIRKIEKNINKQINALIGKYENNDRLDIITLVLLNCSYELHKQNDTGQEKKLIEKIFEIEELIDQI